MRPAFEIAQAVARFGRRLPANGLTTYQKRTLQAIVACRTAALGGHIDACGECGHLRISYNSCRNRHCPKCQGLNKEMWAIQQEEQLLPVPYFHVVFTLPHELNGLCMHNPRFMYGLLLEAGWHTLDSFGSSPKWLGARTAATIVLHTWGQNLSLHPHIHCIVPSGGLRYDGTWQLPKRGNAEFLYPVEAMREVFQAYFMQHLRSALEQGLLALPKGFPYKRGPYYRWKEALYRKNWVAHTKKPFAGPQKVVQYLARYSHRIATCLPARRALAAWQAGHQPPHPGHRTGFYSFCIQGLCRWRTKKGNDTGWHRVPPQVLPAYPAAAFSKSAALRLIG